MFRGMFWRTDTRLEVEAAPLEVELGRPGVAAIVPARNEVGVIGETLPSLLRQRYGGELRVYLVDDVSHDGTASAARRIAEENGAGDKLRVVAGAPLPDGWAGKVWAMQQGYEAASAGDFKYALFTDADISHPAGSVRALVAKAEADGLDMVSVMAKLDAGALAESVLIPAFVFFFGKLYPFRRVNDPLSRTAAAAGGCVLARRDALERIGGPAAIRDRIIDDCALARAVKGSGQRGIWLGLSEQVRSVRGYEGIGGIWRMVARSAYAQLGNSPPLLLGTVAAMALTYLAPAFGVAAGVAGLVVSGSDFAGRTELAAAAVAAGGLGWLMMAAVFTPMLRFYGKPPALSVLMPAAAAVYTIMTVDSARRFYAGAGGAWKGRTY